MPHNSMTGRARVVTAVSGAIVLALTSSVPAYGAGPAGASPVSGAVGAVAPPSIGTLVQAAQQRAVSTGEPVPVESLTTPTELTTALPDGTMQYEAATLPVRVEQDGEWVPIDTDLERDGDWYAPAAFVTPVRFSAGGSDVLSEVQAESGEWVTEVWPHGTLPAPTIDGDTATYAEVLPDVDLKLTATKTGLASVYVVKTAAAASSPELADLHVLVEGADVEEAESGMARAETDEGAELIAGQPLWWDASDGGTFREPGGELPVLPVEHVIGADRVSMDVAASIDVEEDRTGEDVTYPLFIDPDWSSGETASWYTDAAFPSQSYLSPSGTSVLRVGNYQEFKSRMFFQFPLSAMSGKEIISAKLNTKQVKVAACGAQALGVYSFGPKTAGFTWNQEQSFASGTWGSTALQSRNDGDCGTAAKTVGWTVTAGVQSKLGASSIQFGFKPANTTVPSRRHFSRDATLVVNYNTRPNTPTAPTMTAPSRTCATTAATAVGVSATSVTVRAKTTDPDAGNVRTHFYLAEAGALGTTVQKVTTPMMAQGNQSMTISGLEEGTTYAWRAQASDLRLTSPGYSSWCYFYIDTTKPSVPAMSSAATSFAVGSPVEVAVSGAASDVAGYVYWVAPGALVAPSPAIPVGGTVSPTAAPPVCSDVVLQNVRLACANGTTAVSISVAPVDSLSTLWVSAYDKAGNQSAASGFPLYPDGNVATPAAAANIDGGHAWQVTSLSSPLPEVIPDSNPWAGSNAIDLTIPVGSWATVTDLIDPPFEYPVLSGGTVPEAWMSIATDSAPVNVGASFSFSLWLKVPQLPPVDQPIAVQGGSTAVGSYELKVTPSGQYAFCVGHTTIECATGGTVTVGSWQLVTGIWDAGNKQIRLLLGNSITPVAIRGHVTGGGTWPTGGQLEFAPAPDTNRYWGLLADPVVVPGVIDRDQLAQIAGFVLPFS
ncbi:LamG-like jellyroll fold domain-containing protein [Microbacterium tumbae]